MTSSTRTTVLQRTPQQGGRPPKPKALDADYRLGRCGKDDLTVVAEMSGIVAHRNLVVAGSAGRALEHALAHHRASILDNPWPADLDILYSAFEGRDDAQLEVGRTALLRPGGGDWQWSYVRVAGRVYPIALVVRPPDGLPRVVRTCEALFPERHARRPDPDAVLEPLRRGGVIVTASGSCAKMFEPFYRPDERPTDGRRMRTYRERRRRLFPSRDALWVEQRHDLERLMMAGRSEEFVPALLKSLRYTDVLPGPFDEHARAEIQPYTRAYEDALDRYSPAEQRALRTKLESP